MNKQKTSTPAATAVLNRVLRYMLHYYKVPFALVIVCIVITAIATVAGSTFPQTLVDDYITPMLESGSRDFRRNTGLLEIRSGTSFRLSGWKLAGNSF